MSISTVISLVRGDERDSENPQPQGKVRQVLAAQIDHLCEFGNWHQYCLILLCGLIVFVPNDSSPIWPLPCILALVVLAAAAQGLLCNRYRKGAIGPEWRRLWAGLFTLTSLINGLAWGSLGFILFPQLDTGYQCLICLVTLGLAALWVAASACYMPALMAFLIPSLLPISFGFFSSGSEPQMISGAVMLVLTAALSGHGRSLNRQFRDSASREIDNHDAIERLLTGQASENAVQQRLGTALESMSEALAVFDADDRLVVCNRRFLGEQRAGEARDLIGIAFEDLVGRDVGDAGIANAAGREAEYLAERLEYHRKCEGTFIIELTNGRWLQVRDRRISGGGTVIVQTDITAHIRAQDKLRTAKEKAEQANRSKSEFLANTSHELRTPLNAIIGFSEIMASQIFGPLGSARYVEYAQDIHKSGEYLVTVINDLLDLSKIEAGRLDPADDTVALEQVIAAAVNITQKQAKAGHLDLTVSIAPDLPGLRADRRMVQQVLLNLLSNAVKFTPPGGRVEIGAELDRDRGMLIKVSDTGIGMSAEDLERAFEPFGRARGAMIRNFEGTGLGLSLSRSLINLHGGTLDLESTPKVKTVATVRFPANRVLSGDHGGSSAGPVPDTQHRRRAGDRR